MPKVTENKKTRRGSAKATVLSTDLPVVENISIPKETTPVPVAKKMKLSRRQMLLGVIIIVILAGATLAYLKKSWFVVAIVNGRPIFTAQLNQQMTKAVGKDILENMIVEQLVKQEAKKQDINVSEADVNAEVDKIAKSLGTGVTIEEALQYQGMTMNEFRSQVETRLIVNKILSKEVSVSAEEVDTYLKNNAQTLTATGEAERKSEAEQQLVEQKISAKIQDWVKSLMDKAKISRFLN